MILKHLANSKILYVALICGCFCQTQAQEQSIASKEDCLKNGLNCSSDAVCSSMTNGSYVTYTCSCKSGFNGDGFRCYDIDECAAQGIGIGSPCPLEKNQVCVNSIGSYRCVCASYARNASYFKDCRRCKLNCENGGYCLVNNKDWAYCRCEASYTGHLCDKIEPLASSTVAIIVAISVSVPIGTLLVGCYLFLRWRSEQGEKNYRRNRLNRDQSTVRKCLTGEETAMCKSLSEFEMSSKSSNFA